MLKTLIDIVIEASSLMLTDDFKITEKDGISNIVTSSDIAVQEFLRNRLSTLLPDSGFLCEEEDAHDLSHEYVWIIDPIDGTANYPASSSSPRKGGKGRHIQAASCFGTTFLGMHHVYGAFTLS